MLPLVIHTNMKTNRSILTYFSATYTTRKISKEISRTISPTHEEYDITCQSPTETIYCNTNDLLIVGVPVYAGRVPIQAANALKLFKGDNTPAIIICTYGNRAYDDALLELQDIVEQNGFKTIAAATFIAQHSIFPQIAAGRPDEEDYKLMAQFAKDCNELLSKLEDVTKLPKLKINGNHPYTKHKQIPFHPSTLKILCSKCGRCAQLCPTQAIKVGNIFNANENLSNTVLKPLTKALENHYYTDENLCISCGRCLIECPKGARQYFNILHKATLLKFTNNYIERKDPEFFSYSL